MTAKRNPTRSPRSRARCIPVGEGLEVQFTHRGPGDETPCWDGNVLQGGSLVGTFSNSGTGGATRWTGQAEALLRALVDKTMADHGATFRDILEREDFVLFWAEECGYSSHALKPTLFDYLRTAFGVLGA